MKVTFLVLIFCLACSQGPVTKRVSDREHAGFVGPVKKVFVWWSAEGDERRNIQPSECFNDFQGDRILPGWKMIVLVAEIRDLAEC